MKVVLTSSGESLDSPLDPRFGRAQKFILFDTDTNEHQVVDNGIQAAQNVSRLNAEYLITGHCGPKAFRTLQAAGIKVIVGVEGTVAEVMEKFKAGKLTPTETSDVEGHWI